MAKVVIGGINYMIPELNFAGLERAWPFIEQATVVLHPMAGPAAGISIIAAGLMEADDFDKKRFGIGEEETLDEDETFERVNRFLKKKLKATEIENVRICIEQITEEAGLEKAKEGELQGESPISEETPSTETAQTTSQNSSQPDAVGETGKQ